MLVSLSAQNVRVRGDATGIVLPPASERRQSPARRAQTGPSIAHGLFATVGGLRSIGGKTLQRQ
jgi:hypothetical protein